MKICKSNTKQNYVDCWEEAFLSPSIFKFRPPESRLPAIQGRGLWKAFSSSSQNTERNGFPSLTVVSVIFHLARKKHQDVQGRKGPYFGKKWAQVGTL
jgi:hypothetical protein